MEYNVKDKFYGRMHLYMIMCEASELYFQLLSSILDDWNFECEFVSSIIFSVHEDFCVAIGSLVDQSIMIFIRTLRRIRCAFNRELPNYTVYFTRFKCNEKLNLLPTNIVRRTILLAPHCATQTHKNAEIV